MAEKSLVNELEERVAVAGTAVVVGAAVFDELLHPTKRPLVHPRLNRSRVL
jgi:hypothetical protein